MLLQDFVLASFTCKFFVLFSNLLFSLFLVLISKVAGFKPKLLDKIHVQGHSDYMYFLTVNKCLLFHCMVHGIVLQFSGMQMQLNWLK